MPLTASHPGGFYVPRFPSVNGAQTLGLRQSGGLTVIDKATAAQLLAAITQTSSIIHPASGINVNGAQTLSAPSQSLLVALLTKVAAGQTLNAAQQTALVALVDKLIGAQTLFAVSQTSSISLPATATYYVDSAAGSDSNPGTLAAPWASISKVNSAPLAPGAQVLFQGGQTFSGALNCTTSGASSQPLVFGSYGSGRATISSGLNPGFHGTNVAYVTVQNLNFIGAGLTVNASVGVLFENNQAGNTKLSTITLQNCDVSQYGMSGVQIKGGNGRSGFDAVLISNVVSHDNTGNYTGGIGSSGIQVSSDTGYGLLSAGGASHTNVTIDRCTAYNNTGKNGDTNWNGSGIVLLECDSSVISNCVAYNNGALSNYPGGGPVGIWLADCSNTAIRYCRSHDNKTGTIDGSGFDLDGGCQNCTIEYCYSYGNQGYGFMVYAYDDGTLLPNTGNVVRFCISENDAEAGLMIGSDSSRTMTCNVYNNTVYGSLRSLFMYSGSDNVSGLVANNIFRPTSGRNAVYANTNSVNLKLRGNDYWGDSGAVSIHWNGADYSSLAAWKAAATTQETEAGSSTAKSVDPQFATPSQTDIDFELASGSALLNDGLNLQSLYGVSIGSRDYFGAALTAGVYPVGASITTKSQAALNVTAAQTANAATQTSAIHVVSSSINISGAQNDNAVTQSLTAVAKVAVSGAQTLSAPTQSSAVNVVDASARTVSGAQTTNAPTQSSTINVVAQAGTSWTPASIPGVVWFDPSDASKLSTSGGNVNTLTSKGTKSYSLAPIQGSVALVANSNVSGKPALRFTGGNTASGPLMKAIMSDNPLLRGVFAVQKVVSDGHHCFYSFNKTGGGDYVAQGYANYDGSGPDVYHWQGGGGAGDNPGDAMVSAPYVYVARIPAADGVGVQLFVNDTPGDSYGVTAGITDAQTTVDQLFLGAGVFNNGTQFDFTDMDVGAFGFMTVEPSDSDMRKLEGWASWTFNGDGSMLPAGHLYKTAPP